MFDSLPNAIVEHMAELSHPTALSTIAQLEWRCRTATATRLASLARLQAPPYSLCAGEILGRQGAGTKLRLHSFEDAECALSLTAQHLNLTSALGGGALPQLAKLWLTRNRIGPDVMKALCTALERGALRQLTLFDLRNNHISDAGLATLASACGNGAIPQLEVLRLGYNGIGDAGMQEFAAALGCGSRALTRLRELWLDPNHMSDEGMKVFSTALGQGALPALDIVYVNKKHIWLPQLLAACWTRGVIIGGEKVGRRRVE